LQRVYRSRKERVRAFLERERGEALFSRRVFPHKLWRACGTL
jgi:hypothetical protein